MAWIGGLSMADLFGKVFGAACMDSNTRPRITNAVFYQLS